MESGLGESGSGSGDDEEVEGEPVQNSTANLDVNLRFDNLQNTNAVKENTANNNGQNLIQNLQQQQQQQQQPKQLENTKKVAEGQADSRQQDEEKSSAKGEGRELTESGDEESGDENSGESGSGEEDEGLRSKLVENMVKTFAKAANWKNGTKEENETEEENETDEESGEEEEDVKSNNEGNANERLKNDYLTTVTRSVDDSDRQRPVSQRSTDETSTDDSTSNFAQISDNTAELVDAKEVGYAPITLNIKICIIEDANSELPCYGRHMKQYI